MSLVVTVLQPHLDRGRLGVLEHVGQRLLRRSVQGELRLRAERTAASRLLALTDQPVVH